MPNGTDHPKRYDLALGREQVEKLLATVGKMQFESTLEHAMVRRIEETGQLLQDAHSALIMAELSAEGLRMLLAGLAEDLAAIGQLRELRTDVEAEDAAEIAEAVVAIVDREEITH